MINVSKWEPHLRVITKTVVSTNGCWEYQGYKVSSGYGWARSESSGKSDFTHRIIYRWAFGEIKPKSHIDHLCRNKSCCNPSHLEQVTAQENARRASSDTTHCPKGHEYTKENTYNRKDRPGRMCRQCNRERHQ